MSYKKCKVIMIPYAYYYSTKNNIITASFKEGKNKESHLYILSDEEIKEGDWSWCEEDGLWQVTGQSLFVRIKGVNPKIIATTDKSLNLSQPPQSFIERYIVEYNSNLKIEEIMVEYEEIIYHDALTTSIGNPTIEGYRLKISKDNTITTKMVKDSWSREEVEKLFSKFRTDSYYIQFIHESNLDKWLEKNL